MAIDRTTIAKGPGLATLGTTAFHDKDGIVSELVTETEKQPSSIYGELSTRITDQMGKTTLTPVGLVTEGILAKLYPAAYKTPVPGTSVFGATDEACTVHSKDGQKVTWPNSALTNMPEIYLSARKTAFGQAEITHLLENNTERTASGSLVARAALPYSDAGFLESDIKMVKYLGTWGSTLTDIQAAEGWTITPELSLRPEVSDDYGTIDYWLDKVSITARCSPIGLSEDDILTNLPIEQDIGGIPSNTEDLTIAGTGGLTVVLHNATLVEGPLRYGTAERRAGELVWVANPDVTVGGALFTVALTA
jgi:hypothetical protein